MNIRTKVLGGLVTGLFVMALGGIASAHSFLTGSNVNTGEKQNINHSLFIAGETINVSSEVDGDVFCAGQTVNISGTVHGDVICAGQTVVVTGKVDGDVRLAGQTVTLSSPVAGNATIGGQAFTLTDNGSIRKDLTVGSSDVTLNGDVGRDVALGSVTANLDGIVGRNVIGSVEHLNLDRQAHIRGSLKYTSANKLHKSANAKVDGTVSRIIPKTHASKRGAVFGFSVRWFLYWLLALAALALAVALVIPRQLDNAIQSSLPWPWKPLLVGLVASVVVPLCIIVIGITVVGLPIAIIILLIWLVIELLSLAYSAYYIGRLLLRQSAAPLLIALAGAAVLATLLFIPFIGVLVLVLACWTGQGLILLSMRKHLHKPVFVLAPAVSESKKG